MKRILLTIAYDGTNYSGWQKQKDEAVITVEGGFIVMLLGAGAFSAGVIRLADWIDQPRPRRRTA